MHLYDIVPGNLFSVLASANKGLYVNTLFVLWEAFRQHLRIPKTELHAMICSHLEDEIRDADFSDEALLETEQSFSGKAHFLIRKLKSTGWLLIETEQDFKEYVTVPAYSQRIIQLLYDITNAPEAENFAFVYSTYSTLKTADETRVPMEMVTALTDGAQRTEKLVESLKTAYHGITYYHQKLIQELHVNDVLHSHFEAFQQEIVSRILRPLKIRDSVPKYRIPLTNILKKWLIDDAAMSAMAAYLLQSAKLPDVDECKILIREKAFYIIDTYERLEKDYISIIDSKNRQYTHSTTQKIDYLINSDQSVKGNLISVLKAIAAPENESQALELTSDFFEIYELGYLNEESLFERRQGVRRRRNAELILEDLPADIQDAALALAAKVMNSKYSKQKVLEFVNRLLDGRESISTAEFPIVQDDDYILTLLAVVHANAPDAPYRIEYADEYAATGAYRLPLIQFYRKEQT